MADFFTGEIERGLANGSLTLRGREPKRLPMPKDLPVDPHWTCHKSGDCCSLPQEVVMTEQEMRVLAREAPPTIPLHFRPLDQPGMVALKAQPCPLYVFQTCLVYAHRPYNCRRFACMRPDPKTEPLDLSEPASKNCTDRMQISRDVRRLAIQIQRKAQRWANQHGWTQ